MNGPVSGAILCLSRRGGVCAASHWSSKWAGNGAGGQGCQGGGGWHWVDQLGTMDQTPTRETGLTFKHGAGTRMSKGDYRRQHLSPHLLYPPAGSLGLNSLLSVESWSIKLCCFDFYPIDFTAESQPFPFLSCTLCNPRAICLFAGFNGLAIQRAIIPFHLFPVGESESAVPWQVVEACHHKV